MKPSPDLLQSQRGGRFSGGWGFRYGQEPEEMPPVDAPPVREPEVATPAEAATPPVEILEAAAAEERSASAPFAAMAIGSHGPYARLPARTTPEMAGIGEGEYPCSVKRVWGKLKLEWLALEEWTRRNADKTDPWLTDPPRTEGE